MTGALAPSQAQHLRAVLERALDDLGHDQPGDPEIADRVPAARAAILNLLEVLESNTEAVILPAETLLSTQEAAALLGVSRMTVVRLADRGELANDGTGTHRRIRAGELARYRTRAAANRREALDAIAADIDDHPGPDEFVPTR